MAENEVQTATVEQVAAEAGSPQLSKLVADIFSEIHPRLIEKKSTIGEIFTPETAAAYLSRLTDFEALLSEEDSYEQTVGKLQAQIEGAQRVRDEVLAKLFAQLRPIEASYKQIALFFDNTVVPDGKAYKPVEFFIYNADASKMKNRDSATLGAIRRFVKSRNDNFNFRDDICNLVVPGEIPMVVREALEEEAWKWGMLLVTDLADEPDYDSVVKQFRPGGRYEFLKRNEDKASSDVVTVGFLKLRDAHWFEKKNGEDADLYAPASILFAGALARTDRKRKDLVQGPIGTEFGQIKGVDKARFECLISEMEDLSMRMQVIPIIRDADNRLCFYGARTLAEDPYGVYKFFTAYRVLAYIERRVAALLRKVALQPLTRDFIEAQIEKPIQNMLQEQKNQGTLIDFSFSVDKSAMKRLQGVCDIRLEVMPTGPAEVFNVKLDVPDFPPLPSEEGG